MNKKIIFIGTVESSKKMLEKLVSLNANLILVLTMKKSNFNSDFVDLTDICIAKNIEYKFVENINDPENIELIKSKNPDFIFCFGWSQLIKKEILNIPKFGVLGYHPALLPQNRGRHPLIWALALGLNETGSTFFLMDDGADSGDIISQKKIKIDYFDDARSLYDKVISVALNQIVEFYPLLEQNIFLKSKQDHTVANYWRKRGLDDGKIDWRMSSKSIYDLVRSLNKPYVGAHFIYKTNLIKVWKVEEFKDVNLYNIEPGKIIRVNSDNTFVVKVGDNCITVLNSDLNDNLKVGDYL